MIIIEYTLVDQQNFLMFCLKLEKPILTDNNMTYYFLTAPLYLYYFPLVTSTSIINLLRLPFRECL